MPVSNHASNVARHTPMDNTLQKRSMDDSGVATPRRRTMLRVLALGVGALLAACGQRGNAKKEDAVLTVEAFSFVDRFLTTIMFNGQDLGVMNKFGRTGLITGVRIPYGVQSLSFQLDGPEGTPRNGETVTVKNTMVVDEIPKGTQYIGLNIYPDFTAELTFSSEWPQVSARGEQIDAERMKQQQAQ